MELISGLAMQLQPLLADLYQFHAHLNEILLIRGFASVHATDVNPGTGPHQKHPPCTQSAVPGQVMLLEDKHLGAAWTVKLQFVNAQPMHHQESTLRQWQDAPGLSKFRQRICGKCCWQLEICTKSEAESDKLRMASDKACTAQL